MLFTWHWCTPLLTYTAQVRFDPCQRAGMGLRKGSTWGIRHSLWASFWAWLLMFRWVPKGFAHAHMRHSTSAIPVYITSSHAYINLLEAPCVTITRKGEPQNVMWWDGMRNSIGSLLFIYLPSRSTGYCSLYSRVVSMCPRRRTVSSKRHPVEPDRSLWEEKWT